MNEHLIQETNQLRAALPPRTSFTDIRFARSLASRLKQAKVLSRSPAVACFIEDLESSVDVVSLSRTKEHINSHPDNHVFSLFDAPYFPSLSLEFLSYRELEGVAETFTAKFPSQARPVTIETMTCGFADRVVVALFPENHLNGTQAPDDTVFYFIDKFVERHQRITRTMLAHIVDETAFCHVRSANTDDIARASSHWVCLHEHFHHSGALPLPTYLASKTSSKALAGLEELRVDLAGMLACLGDCGLSEPDALLTFEFILCERLLRYAVEGIPRPNYDAVASQLLFNYLRALGGVDIRDGTIYLSAELPRFLQQFLSTITEIEALIAHEPIESVEHRLCSFVDQYTTYDAQLGDYRHIDYFHQVKQRLGV